MSAATKEPVHIVVQHLRGEGPERFRVIAHRGATRFYPVEFGSLADLVRAFRSVMPAFDESQIMIRASDEGVSSIAYTGDIPLDDGALAKIGLRKA